jgi:hypothetical protein
MICPSYLECGWQKTSRVELAQPCIFRVRCARLGALFCHVNSRYSGHITRLSVYTAVLDTKQSRESVTRCRILPRGWIRLLIAWTALYHSRWHMRSTVRQDANAMLHLASAQCNESHDSLDNEPSIRNS